MKIILLYGLQNPFITPEIKQVRKYKHNLWFEKICLIFLLCHISICIVFNEAPKLSHFFRKLCGIILFDNDVIS